jgi:DNA-binding GntR family transcriptional regulator
VADATPIAKGQSAYRELKRRIMTLELAPGALLNEPDLIEQLGLGRTPIREAIQRLAAEKLVVGGPRQTAFVAPIPADELSQIVEMRLILEVPAARLAAERGTASEWARLEAACDFFRTHAAADERDGILAGDERIHALIGAMSRNSFLAEYSERLAAFSQRVWWLSAQNASRDDAFVGCHDDLTRAICARDGEAAARMAEQHVAMFQRRLSGLIQGVVVGQDAGPRADARKGTAA